MYSSYNRRPALRHQATSPSPLRHASTASSNSSAYSGASSDSSGYQNGRHSFSGHKRGLSEIQSPSRDGFGGKEKDPVTTYQSIRQSLKPLSQAPASSPPPHESKSSPKPSPSHLRSRSVDNYHTLQYDGSVSPPPKQARPFSMALSRSDSVRRAESDRAVRPVGQHVHFNPQVERPELHQFQKSSTTQLRTLSKFAESGDDFTIKSPQQEVAGLHGRRRLQRGNSVRAKKTTVGYAGRTWMDTQRQFLQAYEYLCHIGEAKEWIEDIIKQPIPPIVELEEALRDGVTLAEVVQALQPERRLRIFRHEKLQFRHSDNIAIFFRFLDEVELPDLFWFELVDLYEKKNIPKAIYCIHALSWLLFRKGITDFRIGNLVGQLQFEDHELEAMQKGLDKAGISMPNFSGMGANFGAEPEPEPEPVETEDERIDRELKENEAITTDLQAQMRGAIIRIRLGDAMQQLWDAEPWIAGLQAKIRGDFAREISQYRLEMRRSATSVQAAARGFLVRWQMNREQDYWQDREKQVVLMQSLVRARKARAQTQYIKSRAQRHDHGIRQLQAAIRGALKRRDVTDESADAHDAEPAVQQLQAAIRGALARKRVCDQLEDAQEAELKIQKLQCAVRGMLQRRATQTDRTHLRQQSSTILKLQAAARAALVRIHQADLSESLSSATARWEDIQSMARGRAVRNDIQRVRQSLHSAHQSIVALQSASRGREQRLKYREDIALLYRHVESTLSLQGRIRGFLLRKTHLTDLKALKANASTVLQFQSIARGFVERQRTFDLLCALQDHEDSIVNLQSLARGLMLRSGIGRDLMLLEEQEDALIELQAFARGNMVRTMFREKMRFFKQNMEKVIKLQSFVRGKQQGEAYKTLIGGKDPPVGTVKSFVHLLNDSDFDFDEEIGTSHPGALEVKCADPSRIRATSEDRHPASTAKRARGAVYRPARRQDCAAGEEQDHARRSHQTPKALRWPRWQPPHQQGHLLERPFRLESSEQELPDKARALSGTLLRPADPTAVLSEAIQEASGTGSGRIGVQEDRAAHDGCVRLRPEAPRGVLPPQARRPVDQGRGRQLRKYPRLPPQQLLLDETPEQLHQVSPRSKLPSGFTRSYCEG